MPVKLKKSFTKKRRTTRKKYEKHRRVINDVGGGVFKKYVPDLPRPVIVDNLLKDLAKNTFNSQTDTPYTGGFYSGSPPSYVNNFTLYLAGYDDFIEPHKLIPLYDNGGYLQGPKLTRYDKSDGTQLQTSVKLRDDHVDGLEQVYYYLDPIVHDNFIITYKLTADTSLGYGLIDYKGYGGLEPVIERDSSSKISAAVEDTTFIANKHLKYGDKFLLFPPTKTYIEFIFEPTEETNEYNVPNIGRVILNKPAHDEPWYGKTIKILFEPGFVPPEIVDSAANTARRPTMRRPTVRRISSLSMHTPAPDVDICHRVRG